MKLHIGCGQTLINGYINIDNSPSVLLARLPLFVLKGFRKIAVVNKEQMGFMRTLKDCKKEFRYANCLKLPYKENTAEVCYSSHMIGWCLSHGQLNTFLTELKRVLKPGGVLRLSFFDFNECVNEYLQHKNTILLSKSIPLASREFTFREKLKFLLSPNMHGVIVLNRETIVLLLEQNGFSHIRLLQAGETTMNAEQAGEIDLFQRSENSVYVECYKPAITSTA